VGCYPSQPVLLLRSTPTLSPSFRLAQAIFEPNFFPYKYPNILNHSHSSYLLACEDGTDRVFQNVGIQIQMPGNYPEESIQLQKNWRSWICHMVFLILLVWKLETLTDMMSRVLCVCRQQCHLLECGLFCGHYDSRYC